MSVGQKVIPLSVELDNHELNVDELRATYVKNFTSEINDNDRSPSKEGSNQYVFTPLIANTKYCNLSLPPGTNLCCGFHYSKAANQAFIFGHNSNGNHFFYRIFGNSGTCQMVMIDPCLKFQLIPRHFISEQRAFSTIVNRKNKVTGLDESVVYLIITDDYNDQRFFCVEDIIATNGFNASDFPYFATNDPNCDRCTWFNLGVPTPLGCVTATPVARDMSDEEERTKPNLITFKGWQFRVKEIDQWNRGSEHGIISEPYYNQIGNSCLANSSGLSRCFRLRFPAGCPIINQYVISFRNCAGNKKGLAVVSDWYRHTTYNRYNDCENVNWYEREINNPWQVEFDAQKLIGKTDEEASEIAYAKGLTRYHASDNTFEYTFCADKECPPINVNETNRVENPLSKTSGTVFSLNKSIALGKNKKGFTPMDCNELAKIKLTTEKPSPSSCSKVQLRKIEIWGVFYNPNNDVVTSIRKREDGNIIFGYASCPNNNPIAYNQILPKDQEGIIGHLKGTDYYVVSKQYKYDTLLDKLEFVGLDFNLPSARYIPVQKWELNVLPGKYRFHLASHNDSPTDDFTKSSTYFIGRTNLAAPGGLVAEEREIIVDVCDADFTLKNTPIMIWDLTHEGKNCDLGSAAASAVAGYIYEDEIGGDIPIEMAKVTTNHDGDVFKSNYTDHNGFYFATRSGRVLSATLRGFKSCTINQNLASGRSTSDTVENWFKFDRLYAYKNLDTYPVGDRMIIKGKIVLCDSPTVGVPGVLVNLTRGGYAITDVNGEYRIIMHDIGDTLARTEQIMIGQRGSCQILSCGAGCSFCFPNIVVNRTSCTIGTERIINVASTSARINVTNSKGPKTGSRLGWGIFLHDWMGRRSFLQANEDFYLDIPSFQETQVYDFSKILFNLNNATFPVGTKKITFGFTDNLNWDDDLVWVMERVQFVDNTGNVNTAAPTQIRLYYESLNEYNKQNDFSTNSTWQFLTAENNSVTGDLIEFFANADGSIFNTRITALAKYNKEGKYVQIDYSEDLKNLKDGTLVRLIRPKQCVNKEFYYEVCPSIRIGENRKAVIQTGELNYFDSYMLSRQIPVPTLVKKTTENTEGDEIITDVSENHITAYPFFFEHHSPSDTWGDHCANRGRVGTKNPQEKERRLNTIDVSNALVNDGFLNGLHYYEDKDSLELPEQEWGTMTAAVVDINFVLVIFEFANCILSYNDDMVRVNREGGISAPTVDSLFGKPQRVPGNNFGCQPDDINTIHKRNGLVLFVDSSKSSLVRHTFSEAKDISVGTEQRGGYKSWLSAVIKHVIANNSNPENPKKYWHSAIDPKGDNLILSIVTQGQSGSKYVNTKREPDITDNDTIVVNIYTGALKTFLSCTPEYWGAMEGDINDLQMLSFKFGEAWMHHKINNSGDIFNRVYGTNVEKIVEVVYNLDSEKVKRYMWTEVYCRQQLFFIDRIITESGQLSRLMPLWWDRRDKFFTADFKCDVNTQADINLVKETGVNALLDGNMLYGRWMRVRYIGLTAAINAYCELTALVGYMYGSEKSGVK